MSSSSAGSRWASARPRLILAGNLPGAAVAYDRFGTAASSAGTFSIDYRDTAVGTLSGAARCVVVAAVTGRVAVEQTYSRNVLRDKR